MSQIGLKNLYAAKITEDALGNETYGTPKRLAKAINADITVNSDTSTLYADDGADVTVSEFTDGTLKLDINDLSNANAAELLGAAIDSNGVLISTGEDTPPAYAIGMQSKSGKGGDRFLWLYRVVFGIPNQSFKTKGEKIEFTTPSIEGKISRRNKTDANGKHPWKADVKAGDPGVSAATVNNWFNHVYEPGSSADASLSALTISGLTLSPQFDSDKTEYTTTASGTSSTITATKASSAASVVIAFNGNSLTNGGSVTWAEGINIIEITVTNGSSVMRYTVTVSNE